MLWSCNSSPYSWTLYLINDLDVLDLVQGVFVAMCLVRVDEIQSHLSSSFSLWRVAAWLSAVVQHRFTRTACHKPQKGDYNPEIHHDECKWKGWLACLADCSYIYSRVDPSSQGRGIKHTFLTNVMEVWEDRLTGNDLFIKGHSPDMNLLGPWRWHNGGGDWKKVLKTLTSNTGIDIIMAFTDIDMCTSVYYSCDYMSYSALDIIISLI